MGATAKFICISPWLIDQLNLHPELVEPFVCACPPTLPPGIPEHIAAAVLNNEDLIAIRKEEEGEIKSLVPDIADRIIDEAQVPGFTLDKAWREIQLQISGVLAPTDVPGGSAILGGTAIGPDLGYGQARYLTSEEVQAVADELDALEKEEFYRTKSDEPVPDEFLDFAWSLVTELTAYYRKAADENKGMLMHLA